MRYTQLGTTGIEVSDLCLGTMTFGTQTSEADAHRQINTALAAGINFIDTAEMYPVNPVSAETVGRTEEIVGNWVASSGKRQDVVIATKITGANGGFCRDGEGISSASIVTALDQSLRRLQTDVIDLYQLHWPNRGSYCFRQNWEYDPSGQDKAATIAHMDDVLAELQRQVEAGKIRHVGLSNESAWGTTMWRTRAALSGGPLMQTIQNEYSLLHRLFDTDLAETCANEGMGLLSYSPLACGLLTGKYRDGACPEGSRLSLSETLNGRMTPRSLAAVEAYVALAEEMGHDFVHMSLAFCRSRPFMGSTIFGARTQAQLDHILAGVDLVLSDEEIGRINALHREHPLPY